MEEKKNKKASFKEYNYEQTEMFPSNMSEQIPEKHLVRVVDKIIESIDLTPILETYKGGGCSSYHPKMALKVIIYAYCEKIYSSRKIEKALKDKKENKEIDGKKLKELKQTIDESLKSVADKTLNKASKQIEKDYLPRLEKYEKQEESLKDRNSYSKTDEGATFMRMKDDHMKNGQLKAAYNIQIGTQEQFILNYSIRQKTTDTSVLIPHFEELKDNIDLKPKNVIADAGYGSEENYEYMNDENITGYVKYNTFRIEDTKKFKADIFNKENFPYDKEKNEYICPNNKRLKYEKTRLRKTDNGYETKIDIYTCEDCSDCKYKTGCTKSENKRSIQINYRLNELRHKAKRLLTDEKGIRLRKKRGVEVESVFGHIKWDRGFNRFML